MATLRKPAPLTPQQLDRRYVDIPAAAMYLGVSEDFIRTRIAAGKLPAKKIGYHSVRIRVCDLDAFGEPMQPNLNRAKGKAAEPRQPKRNESGPGHHNRNRPLSSHPAPP